MAIAIEYGRITGLINAPTRAPAITWDDTHGRYVGFTLVARNRADGQVKFTGHGRDSRDGWDVGGIQVAEARTNWGMYRGEKEEDGSVFVQRGGGSANRQRMCLDISRRRIIGDVFTRTKEAAPWCHCGIPTVPFPVTVALIEQDQPFDWYDLETKNALAKGRTNYLDEVQMEFKFCTVLSVRDSARTFHHLAHFYWSARWHYTFHPKRYSPKPEPEDWTVTPVEGGNGATMSAAYQFPPRDANLTRVLTAKHTLDCHGVVDLASQNTRPGGPGRREYADRNHKPDVRR